MLVFLSNLTGILVRGPDGSGWLVSHGCRGFDRPFVGIMLLGFGFSVEPPLSTDRPVAVNVVGVTEWDDIVYEAYDGILHCISVINYQLQDF